MMNHSLSIITALVTSTIFLSSAHANDEIETKYLMFKMPKVRFDDILQLKKPGGKLSFGNGVELGYDDVEPLAGLRKNVGYSVVLKKALKVSDVTIHPKCSLEFVEPSDKELGRYLLVAVDCQSGSVEINRTKLKGQFHSTFAKDAFHFACIPINTVTEVPLLNGKKVPPNKTIWIEDFDADRNTNPVSGISNHYPKADK